MKKLKILPSVLMLVLCVGVLCMGIYAASPNSNQITGSITINAANPEVSYKAYLGNVINDSTLIGQTSGRQNNQLVLDSENLVLDMSSAATKEDVAPIEIWLELTNKSTSESLGAYFAEGAVNRTAVYNDILRTQPIYEDPEAQEKNTVANINLPFYHQLPKATVEGGETTYYPVYMRLTITPATMVESRLENLEFTLNLNVESYVGSTDTTDDLYKVPEGVTLEPVSGLAFKGCKGIVFSSNCGGLSYLFGMPEEPIEGMEIEDITIAPGATYIGFYGYAPLCEELVIPSTVTTFNCDWDIKVYVPCSLQETESDISTWVFYGNMDGISYENEVLSITGAEAFENYPAMVSKLCKNLYIGDGVTVGSQFYENSVIETLEMAGTAAFEHPEVFLGCANLKTVVLNDGIEIIPMSTFASCTSLTSIKIPTSVTEIYDCVFGNCESLTSIYIPSSVTYVGSSAFYGCNENFKAYCNAVGAEWESEWNAFGEDSDGLVRFEPITGVATYEDYLALINA